MVGHNDVAQHSIAVVLQNIKPFVNKIIASGMINNRLPTKASEGYKINSFRIDWSMNRHETKIKNKSYHSTSPA